MTNKVKIGYATGVFDLFHIGHLNLLKNAKSKCDYLIAGVTTDALTIALKGRPPIIPFEERLKIVESIKYVDRAVAKISANQLIDWEVLKFDIYFKGDDWKGTIKGMALEKSFEPYGVEVEYFSYTKHTSSTILQEILKKMQKGY
jgi:glycerol-3-phosphate cytidylyltransferase